MADSNLTKMDVLNFLNLGRKIAVSGAGAVLDVARSKLVELTDSEQALQRRVAAQVKGLVEAGFSEAEAYKAIADRMKNRVDRAIQEFNKKPSGDNAEKK